MIKRIVVITGCILLLAGCSPAFAQLQYWVKLHDTSINNNEFFTDVVFTSDSVGYVVGATPLGGIILKTTDRGSSWQVTYPQYALSYVYFVTDSLGFTWGQANRIYRTTDAGNSWSLNYNPLSNLYELMDMHFIDEDTGFIAVANGPTGAFLQTYNGGQTWNNTQNWYTRAIAGFNSTVIAIDWDNYRSTNGGVTWTTNSSPGFTFRCLKFFSDSLAYMWGTDFSVSKIFCKTFDGGQTWVTTPYQYGNFYFPTPTLGYASADTSIAITQDGGASWSISKIDTITHASAGVNAIYCTDSLTCYAVTGDGRIYKTTTGGGVGIAEQTNKEGAQVNVYPNPFSTSTTFEIAGTKGTVNLYLFDQLGREVMRIEGIEDGRHKLNREGLSSGLYYYSLHNNTGRIASGKLIVD